MFSATGGIEKVCRIAGKALFESFGGRFRMLILHDNKTSNRYFPGTLAEGCKGSLFRFFLKTLRCGKNYDVIIMSHINLLPAGWLLKKLYPSKKLYLFIHGIEVWNGVKGNRKKMLGNCDHFIAVSNFTANRFSESAGVSTRNITVLNNCLDPFLAAPVQARRERAILTLTRLASTEKAKGYDSVIQALAAIGDPTIKYIIAGKYTQDEYERVKAIAEKYGVWDQVDMRGFVNDDDLPSLFAEASLYVMPSTKEGFGIVFVEAMYYGLPVIGSNADGSADALRNGELGIMVKPGDIKELANSIRTILADPSAFSVSQNKVKEYFSFEKYKTQLLEIVSDEQG